MIFYRFFILSAIFWPFYPWGYDLFLRIAIGEIPTCIYHTMKILDNYNGIAIVLFIVTFVFTRIYWVHPFQHFDYFDEHLIITFNWLGSVIWFLS